MASVFSFQGWAGRSRGVVVVVEDGEELRGRSFPVVVVGVGEDGNSRGEACCSLNHSATSASGLGRLSLQHKTSTSGVIQSNPSHRLGALLRRIASGPHKSSGWCTPVPTTD